MRLSIVTRAVLAAAVVAAIAAPVPAHAQFGKLLKKAKEKVVGDKDSSAAAESSGGASGPLQFREAKFDADLIELTPEVLDRVMRGMSVEVAVLKRSAESGKNLSDEVESANKEYDQIGKDHPDEERQAWEESNSRINDCISEKVGDLNEKHQGDLQARVMSDPALRQKMTDITMKASEASQRGDTAATRKYMDELEAVANPYAKEDSAAARKQCGTPAPKPAWLVRQEKLATQRSALADSLRKLEGRARDTAIVATGQGGGAAHGGGSGQNAGAAHGGGGGQGASGQLTRKQYSLALERLVGWAAATEPGSKSGQSYARLARYSSTELAAMQAKEAELRSVTSELRDFHVWN
jgi:hypothetical protein